MHVRCPHCLNWNGQRFSPSNLQLAILLQLWLHCGECWNGPPLTASRDDWRILLGYGRHTNARFRLGPRLSCPDMDSKFTQPRKTGEMPRFRRRPARLIRVHTGDSFAIGSIRLPGWLPTVPASQQVVRSGSGSLVALRRTAAGTRQAVASLMSP